MKKGKTFWLCALAFSVPLCLSVWILSSGLAGMAGQDATQAIAPQGSNSQQPFTLRTQTNEVLVDVRVYDKSGKPVTDLKQSDFRVTEDGVQQTISDFSLEDVEKLAQAQAGDEASKVIDLAKLPPQVNAEQVLQNHRLLVLFFDISSMQPDELIRAIKASNDFIEKHLTPADLVAIVTYSASLRVAQDFTNDRAALHKVLQAIVTGDQSGNLANQGAIGEAGGADANGMEIVTQDVSDAFTPDETEFNIFNTDEKLAAIESLSTMLRAVPGRKNVIHFSSGITRTGQENQATLRAATDSANQADVSLYTMDARGLAALPPGGDATSSSPSNAAIYSGSAVASQVASLQGSRETLAALSADTGGRTFYDLNDFSSAFADVQRENSSYYLIGYSPSSTRDNGRFRHIRVEVSRPGVKVQARPGYFAAKSFTQLTRAEKENQLQQAMDLDEPFVDLPFVVETAYFRRPDKKYSVLLAAKIPGSEVAFLKKSGKRETAFDFAWKVSDAQNHIVGALRDTLPVRVTQDTLEEIIGSNLFYEGEVDLPPGKFNLKAVVRENESGKIGTFEAPLEIPDVPDSALGLSSVILSNEVKSADDLNRAHVNRDKNSPLEVNGRSILPSVTRVFRSNQLLTVYLQSYAGKGLAAHGPATPPSVGLVFFRHGSKIAEAGPYPGKLEKSDDQRASYFVQIPLDKFPRGTYTLQLNVLDPSLDRVAFARIPLAVVPPHARKLAATAPAK